MPSSSDSTGISIFMDSRTTTVSPSATVSPTLQWTFHTVPVMCASTWAIVISLTSERNLRALGMRR